MKKYLVGTSIALALAGSLAAGAANASIACSTSDVQVTQISQYSAVSASATLSPVYSGSGIGAYTCAGAYSGNATPYPTLNLGYSQDGLLNGAPQQAGHSGTVLFPGGAFVAPSDLSNLQGLGNIDPGWIFLGKVEFGAGPLTFSPASIGGNSSIVLASFFSVVSTGAGTGTWALTPDALVAQRAQQLLGNNYFDQFALVFKQANNFAAYDFTAAQFGITALTANDPVYTWGGSYDVSKTLKPAGMSHIDLYARDPGGSPTVIPEPGTLALLGLALFGLAAVRKSVRGK